MGTSRAVLLKWVADGATRALLPLVLLPLLSRHAGADAVGAYAQLLTIAGLAAPFLSLGITPAIVGTLSGKAWTPELRRLVDRILLVVGATGALGGLLMAAAAAGLDDLLLRIPAGPAVFRWGGLLLVALVLEQLVLELLRARLLLVAYAALQLAQTLAVLVLAVWLIPSGSGIVDIVRAIAVVKLATAVLGRLVVARPSAAVDPTAPANLDALVRFGIPLALAGVGAWLTNISDRLVVGAHLGADAVGRYSAVFFTGALLWVFSGALNLPAYPRIVAALATGDRSGVADEVRLFHHYLGVTLLPLSALLVAAGPYALDVAGGNRFSVSYLLVGLVITTLVLTQWNGLAHYVVTGSGRTTYLRNTWLLAGAGNLVLNLVLVPLAGLNGAGIAGLLTAIGLEVTVYRAADQHVSLREAYDLRGTAVVSALAVPLAVLAAVALEVGPGGPAPLVLVGGAYLVLFLAGAALLGQVRKHDLGLLLHGVGVRGTPT